MNYNTTSTQMELEEVKIGSGLQNLGNTCFFNAVMQSVLHTKKLTQYFSSKNHSKNCRKEGWCVFCQMERTYHITRNGKVYSPYNLVNNLKKIFKKFKLGRQQDSHEFLRYLVEGMQDCETGPLPKEREKAQRRIRQSNIFNIYGGSIMNVVKCLSCKHKSITKERYYDLNIECQKSDSLQQGLEKFFATDQLKGHNKYHCENCKNKVDATKRFYIEKAPETLTFQLKRFTNMLRKIGKYIKYPKFIHIGKYYLNERKTIGRLSAVIVHAGSSSYSGHYYAFIRTGETWYRMDDSHVSKCSQQQAMGQNAYILFYEKVKDVPLKSQKSAQNPLHISEKIMGVQEKLLQVTQKHQQKQNKLGQKTNLSNNIFNSSVKQSEIVNEPIENTKSGIKNLQSSQIMKQEQNVEMKEVQKKDQMRIQKPRQAGKEFINLTLSNSNGQKNQSLCQSRVSISSNVENLEVPQLVTRKRSKQQAQQSVTLQEMVHKLAVNLENLESKLPPPYKPGYRTLRSINNLRKYQIVMKKRKLC